MRLLQGSEREVWQSEAQRAASAISGTGNQSDVSKNAEAQEGLKAGHKGKRNQEKYNEIY